MNKSIFIKAIILLFCVISICGCSNKNTQKPSTDNYVSLFDYKNIEIEKEYIEISNEDLETIINLDFSSKNYYKKVYNRNSIENGDIIFVNIISDDNLFFFEDFYEVGNFEISEDFDKNLIGKKDDEKFKIETIIEKHKKILNVEIKGIYTTPSANDVDALTDFYSMKSKNEVISFLTKRAQDELIYNYMWEIVLKNSTIKKYPDYIEKEISNYKNELLSSAKKNNQSLEEYLEEMNTNENEIKNSINNYYFEIMIAEAIIKNENEKVTTEDIIETKNNFIKNNNITESELYSLFTEEELYNKAMMNKAKKILVNNANIV